MIDQDTARKAIYALLDLLDAKDADDIEYTTGLFPERCIEIETLCSELYRWYGKDWLSQ